MKIAIMQPYIFPYIGYFQLINAVDKFILLDDVNFIKGGWINRNNILVNNQKHLFTIALDQSSPNKLINEILIKDNFNKFLKTIQFSYLKAPFYKQTLQLLEEILFSYERNLAKFISNSIIAISDYLGIETEFMISSKLDKNNDLRSQEKVLHICGLLGTDTYINAIGGQDLYNKAEFRTKNIELAFIKSNSIVYKQFSNEFVPWLSIIDVIMFNSPTEISIKLNNYELV